MKLRTTLYSLAAVLMLTTLAACDNDAAETDDVEFTTLDSSWDAEDQVFVADYDSARTAYDRMAAQQIADSGVKARLEAHNKALQDLETRRVAARERREAARTAKDVNAYNAARAEADYQAWRAEVQRIRAEQVEIEGMINIGSKSVGGIDVNAAPGNQDKPLIRVEPGKDDDKPLIRIEPGKDDDKPLIEKNKNP